MPCSNCAAPLDPMCCVPYCNKCVRREKRTGNTTRVFYLGKLIEIYVESDGTAVRTDYCNGEIVGITNYCNGKRHGMSSRYDSGKLVREAMYLDGKLLTQAGWATDGTCVLDAKYLHGKLHGDYMEIRNGVKINAQFRHGELVV